MRTRCKDDEFNDAEGAGAVTGLCQATGAEGTVVGDAG